MIDCGQARFPLRHMADHSCFEAFHFDGIWEIVCMCETCQLCYHAPAVWMSGQAVGFCARLASDFAPRCASNGGFSFLKPDVF